jgi:hypothetical protein
MIRCIEGDIAVITHAYKGATELSANLGSMVEIIEQVPSALCILTWRCRALTRVMAHKRNDQGIREVACVMPGQIVQVYDEFLRPLRYTSETDETLDLDLAGPAPRMSTEYWLDVMRRSHYLESLKGPAHWKREQSIHWFWTDRVHPNQSILIHSWKSPGL